MNSAVNFTPANSANSIPQANKVLFSSYPAEFSPVTVPVPSLSTCARKGKWTPEEEQYANKIIELFHAGMLPLRDGTPLRSFLSERLKCDPMRISKKFCGSQSIGIQYFQRSQQYVTGSPEAQRVLMGLDKMEKRFLRSIGIATMIPVGTSCLPLPAAAGGASLSGQSGARPAVGAGDFIEGIWDAPERSSSMSLRVKAVKRPKSAVSGDADPSLFLPVVPPMSRFSSSQIDSTTSPTPSSPSSQSSHTSSSSASFSFSSSSSSSLSVGDSAAKRARLKLESRASNASTTSLDLDAGDLLLHFFHKLRDEEVARQSPRSSDSVLSELNPTLAQSLAGGSSGMMGVDPDGLHSGAVVSEAKDEADDEPSRLPPVDDLTKSLTQ